MEGRGGSERGKEEEGEGKEEEEEEEEGIKRFRPVLRTGPMFGMKAPAQKITPPPKDGFGGGLLEDRAGRLMEVSDTRFT